MASLIGRIAGRLVTWAPVLGLGCLLAVILHGHDFFTNGSFACNSDTLNLLDLVGDFLRPGQVQEGTHCPGAPYLFPDVVLLAPAVLTTANVVLRFLIYGLVFFAILGALAGWIARLAGLSPRAAATAGLAGVLLLLVTHLSPAYAGPAFMMFRCGCHAGALLSGLLLLGLVLAAARTGYGPLSAGAVVLVGGLGAFSDKLLIVQFLAPTLAVLFVLWLAGCCRARFLLLTAALFGGAFLVSRVIELLFTRLGFVVLPIEGQFGIPTLRRCRLLLGVLANAFRGQHASFVVYAVFWPVALAVIAASFCRRGTSRETGPPGTERVAAAGVAVPSVGLLLALLAVAGSLTNLAAVMVAIPRGDPTGMERYLEFPMWVPFLFLGVLAGCLPGWAGRRGPALFAAAVTAFTAFRFATHPPVNPEFLRPPYPDLVQAIDQLARERDCRHGLAPFWETRAINHLAHEPVMVHAVVFPDAQPWLHTFNPDSLLARNPRDLALPRYDFIVLARNTPGSGPPSGPEPGLVALEHGEPTEKRVVGGYEIWVYDRLCSVKLDQFLKSFLAVRWRRHLPYRRPAVPRCLSRPKHNFEPWNAPGTVLLQAGGQVEVRFGRPVFGQTLDICCAANAEYAVTFFHGGDTLGCLAVPPMAWTGCSYRPSGLHARLLALPEGVRGQPWDRAIVQAVRGDGKFSVGHLLVYDEPLPPPPAREHRPDRGRLARLRDGE
jgi:hypothetical protein